MLGLIAACRDSPLPVPQHCVHMLIMLLSQVEGAVPSEELDVELDGAVH